MARNSPGRKRSKADNDIALRVTGRPLYATMCATGTGLLRLRDSSKVPARGGWQLVPQIRGRVALTCAFADPEAEYLAAGALDSVHGLPT